MPAMLTVSRSRDGVHWDGWQDLGGNLTAAPAAAAFGGRLYAFAKGVDPQRPTIFPLYAKSSADGASLWLMQVRVMAVRAFSSNPAAPAPPP